MFSRCQLRREQQPCHSPGRRPTRKKRRARSRGWYDNCSGNGRVYILVDKGRQSQSRPQSGGVPMADDGLPYSSLTEVAAAIRTPRAVAGEVTEAILERIERLEPKLHSYATVTADLALEQARAAEREIASGRYRGAAARRADRGQGPVLHQGHPDRLRHQHPRRLEARDRCHRGRALPDRGRGAARQAADDRGRVRRPPSQGRAAAQPLERRPLGRRLVVGLGRRDGRRALLRLARLRHRRLDPLPLGRQRRHRPQADLGPGQPLRRFSALGIARPHRARWRAARPMRQRSWPLSRGPMPTIRPRLPAPVPDYVAGLGEGVLGARGLRIGIDAGFNGTGVETPKSSS